MRIKLFQLLGRQGWEVNFVVVVVVAVGDDVAVSKKSATNC